METAVSAPGDQRKKRLQYVPCAITSCSAVLQSCVIPSQNTYSTEVSWGENDGKKETHLSHHLPPLAGISYLSTQYTVTEVKRKMLLLLISTLLFNTLSPSQGASVPLELVDMTYTFDETTLVWPTQKKFELNVLVNGTTEEGYWLQMEDYSSATHIGTHMDAPCHVAFGKWCVDEIPLERLQAPAAVVDIIDKAADDPDAFLEIDDLKKWEEITCKSLNGTIVVMKSGWGRRWGDAEAFFGTSENDTENPHFPAISPEAAQWLVDNRKIYGFATDAFSVDNTLSRGFMSHQILYENNIYGLESVANVEKIPIDGATLQVMPMKIGKGSGAPVRIIASYPKATR